MLFLVWVIACFILRQGLALGVFKVEHKSSPKTMKASYF